MSLNYSVSLPPVHSPFTTGLGKQQKSAMMVLTQRDLMGRTKIGKEEPSAGRCQAGPRTLQNPSLLLSRWACWERSGEGAVGLSGLLLPLGAFVTAWINVCVGVY